MRGEVVKQSATAVGRGLERAGWESTEVTKYGGGCPAVGEVKTGDWGCFVTCSFECFTVEVRWSSVVSNVLVVEGGCEERCEALLSAEESTGA